MLQHFLVGVGGVIGLIAAWVAVQSLARRHLPEPPDDADVPSCGLCRLTRACHCGPSDEPQTPAPRLPMDTDLQERPRD